MPLRVHDEMISLILFDTGFGSHSLSIPVDLRLVRASPESKTLARRRFILNANWIYPLACAFATS